MIRLVASDLDGTLLAPDGTIDAETVASLRAARDAGVTIVVATGRPSRWLDCLAPIAGLDPYVLASNGAVRWDLAGGRVLASSAFEPGAVTTMAALIRESVPDAVFGLERGDLFGVEPGSPSDHAAFPGVLQFPLADLVARVRPVVKFIVYSARLPSDVLTDAVAAAVGGLACVTTSVTHDEFGMAELSVPGVTKGAALADLCLALGVSAADVAAFGDMPNDAEMLAWAGHGFVMANGHAALRERFTVVGSCAEGGVGRHLRTLLRDA